MYSRLMAMPELAGLRSEIEPRCGAAHFSRGLFLMQTGHCGEARKHLRDAVALQGLTPKIGLAFALASMPGAHGSGLLKALRRLRQW
jgi:hypothetical protein